MVISYTTSRHVKKSFCRGMTLTPCAASSVENDVSFSATSSSLLAEPVFIIYFDTWPRRKTRTSAVDDEDELSSVAVR